MSIACSAASNNRRIPFHSGWTERLQNLSSLSTIPKHLIGLPLGETGITIYRCQYCSTDFITQSELKHHFAEQHNNNLHNQHPLQNNSYLHEDFNNLSLAEEGSQGWKEWQKHIFKKTKRKRKQISRPVEIIECYAPDGPGHIGNQSNNKAVPLHTKRHCRVIKLVSYSGTETAHSYKKMSSSSRRKRSDSCETVYPPLSDTRRRPNNNCSDSDSRLKSEREQKINFAKMSHPCGWGSYSKTFSNGHNPMLHTQKQHNNLNEIFHKLALAPQEGSPAWEKLYPMNPKPKRIKVKPKIECAYTAICLHCEIQCMSNKSIKHCQELLWHHCLLMHSNFSLS